MCQVELRMDLMEDEAQQTKHNSLQEHIPYLPSLNDNSPLLQWQSIKDKNSKNPFARKYLQSYCFLLTVSPSSPILLSNPFIYTNTELIKET